MNAIELANQTGLHKNTIYKMIQSGEIKAEKKGKSFQVNERQAKEAIYAKYSYLKNKEVFNATQSLIDGIKQEQIELFKTIMTLAEDVLIDYDNEVERANEKYTKEEDRKKYIEKIILHIIDDSSFPDLFNAFGEFMSNDEYIKKLIITQRKQLAKNNPGSYEKHFLGVEEDPLLKDGFTYLDYSDIDED